MTKIYKITGEILFKDDSLSLKELVEKHKKNLYGANLYWENLVGADLRDADLGEADLRYADLYGANLGEANLRDADLRGAYLREAYLMGANLQGANLRDATILNYKEIGGIGNYKRLLRCFLLNDNSFYFMAGCFSGTEQELKEKVIDKYGSDCEYIEAIEFLKNLCIKYKGE